MIPEADSFWHPGFALSTSSHEGRPFACRDENQRQTEGTLMKKTARLKQLLADQKLLMAPGAYDVLSAKVVEMAGFDAVYMTGYGTSASPTSGS